MFRFAVLLGLVTTLAYSQDVSITQGFTIYTEASIPETTQPDETATTGPEDITESPDIPDFSTTVPDIPTEEPTDITTQPEVQTERLTAAGVTTQLPLELRQPKITEHPRNVTVPEDSYAKFFCSATGSPSPHLVIVRADSNYVVPSFSKNHVRKGEESLPEVQQTIGPITKLNEGWYECIAANFWGTVKSRAYLRVLDLCSEIECTAPKTCVQNYDEAKAECQCPELLCDKHYEPVCGSDCTVHFNPCLWNKTSCTNDYDSSNIIGTGRECPPTTDPEVTLVEGEDSSIDEGETFRLRAAVSGYPEPIVEWQKVDDDGNFLLSVGKGLELVLQVTLEMSGRYVARGTNCQTRHVYTESVVLNVIPLPEPTEPAEVATREDVNVCSVFGDPHIVTFDKHSLHFSGACTYVLAMDCAGYSWFIYGLFDYCGHGTCLQELTIYINYKAMVLTRGWIIYINTEKQHFIEGKRFEAGGLSWYFDGLILTGRSDELGLTIAWDGFVSFSIAIDESKGDTMCGVCGNNDGDKSNDHLQSTKLDERLKESLQSNIYVDNWKIDREKMCVLPAEVDFNPAEPCGTNYGKTREAIEACQAIVENPALQRCVDTVDLKFYYDSCLHDYCYMTLLRKDPDPYAKPSPVINPECTIARAYASVCELEGISMKGWDVYMKTCGKEMTQDAIVSISSFQKDLPFIRFRM